LTSLYIYIYDVVSSSDFS